MESREEVNAALAAMGEPPLNEDDVVRTSGDQVLETAVAKHIELVEPAGYRRANLVFLNGRFLLIDMQDDELVEKVNAFLDDPNPNNRYLSVPIIDTIDEGKPTEVVVAAPIHLTRRALEMMQSIGRSWPKKVPGQAPADSRIPVVRGSDAERVLQHIKPNREQRRRLHFVGRDGG